MSSLPSSHRPIARTWRRTQAALSQELRNLIPVCNHGLAAILVLVWLADVVTLRQLVAAFLVGNLADIDSAYARIGRLVYPLARWIELKFGHRTITHSLLAVGAVAAIARLAAGYGLEPWTWWWWPAWYATHLVVDMVISASRGVPLLWPANHLRFYLLRVQPGSSGEQICCGLLLAALAVSAIGVRFEPYRYLHERAATLQFALQDYRAWEPFNTVYVDIEGTWQDARHTPISGRFEVERVEGATLYLKHNQGSGLTFSAGQHNEEVYLRAVVAVRGPARAPAAPLLPTPALVKITIAHVYDPAGEIKVQAGDLIRRRQVLADLATYRAQLSQPAATPTRTATPLPTATATDAPNPLTVARAQADLAVARARATQVAGRDPQAVAAAAAHLALAARELQQAQSAYDQVGWRSDIGMRPEALRLEEATQRYQLAEAQATATAQAPSSDERAVALAQLHKAEIDYQYAVATLTPHPTTPPVLRLPTATSTPTPTPDTRAWQREVAEKTVICALVAGTVKEIRIASVLGNVATVEIWVQVHAPAAPLIGSGACVGAMTEERAPAQPADNPLPTPTAGGPSARWPRAQVIRPIDGDTLDVQILDNASSGLTVGETYRVRFIGVDTPETKHPTLGIQCYGPEAATFTAHLAPAGAVVNLELDVDPFDRYDRLLAYVYLSSGDMLNQRLVAGGYARVATFPPNVKYVAQFAAGETSARAAGRGLWRACPAH